MKNWRLVNIFTLIGVLIVNALANGLPLNGQTTAELSDRYPALLTPAGYVFSIWGLIYLALIGFSVFQNLPGQIDNQRLNRIGGWFSAANLLNAGWLFAWHWEKVWLSVGLMVGLLASLLIIYTRLEIGKHGRVPPLEQWLVDFPFSLYLGWISVALVTNISAALISSKWGAFGLTQTFWAIVLIIIITLLGLLMIRQRNALTYPAVLIWALLGIRLRPGQEADVSTAAGLAAFVLLLYIVFRLLRARQAELVSSRVNRTRF
jgi:hypothetical protein